MSDLVEYGLLIPLIPDNPGHSNQSLYQSDNIYSVLTSFNVKSGLRLEKGKSEECKEFSYETIYKFFV